MPTPLATVGGPYGSDLAGARRAAGIASSDLAAHAGIDPDDLDRFERGELTLSVRHWRNLYHSLVQLLTKEK